MFQLKVDAQSLAFAGTVDMGGASELLPQGALLLVRVEPAKEVTVKIDEEGRVRRTDVLNVVDARVVTPELHEAILAATAAAAASQEPPEPETGGGPAEEPPPPMEQPPPVRDAPAPVEPPSPEPPAPSDGPKVARWSPEPAGAGGVGQVANLGSVYRRPRDDALSKFLED